MPSMLPISHLLNPASPELSDASSDEAGTSASTTTQLPALMPTGSSSSSSSTMSMSMPYTAKQQQHTASRPRAWSTSSSSSSSSSSSWPGKPSSSSSNRQRGPVNFMPHECGISAAMLDEIAAFQVRPFGHIRQSCEHIPYNSSKKDFFGKTGRESIDVLKYEFRPRGAVLDYTVMWDYDVGLVRITPFFKCLGYAKTKPSQMLDKNPGLRDITPSITGGAVSAQGYWMPFKCAKAVCATFCYNIAPALVPLFGPSFPSECRMPGTPGYRDMTIDPRIIHEATREAHMARSLRSGSGGGISAASILPSSSVAHMPMSAEHEQHHQEHHQHNYRRLAHPTPQRIPSSSSSSWKAINTVVVATAAASPITPPRSSNSQRALMSGSTDGFRHQHQHPYQSQQQPHGNHADNDAKQDDVVPMEENSYHQNRHHHHHHQQRVSAAYGLKRRLVSPVIVQFSSDTTTVPRPYDDEDDEDDDDDRTAAPAARRLSPPELDCRSRNSPRKRTHREEHRCRDDVDDDGSDDDDSSDERHMQDYHDAASALVGMQGERRTCRSRSCEMDG